ncbi:MAG TPA: DUF2460 domain-containing protein [Stellaceae bacterium]|nr:DUF2460 domain-containing protein [Stellaceae bacterium]
MSLPIFPLASLPWAYSLQKHPVFSTRVAKHVSGREVALALYAYPLWGFELTFEVLRAAPGLAEYQTLLQFFLAARGQFGRFLFQDPTDFQATGQLLATGDGATASFTFLHPLGADLSEPAGQVDLTGINVYLDGTPPAAGTWSVTLPNTLALTTPPPAGVQVTADYSFYFLCRFDEDSAELENFMDQLWSLKSLKFTSVKEP